MSALEDAAAMFAASDRLRAARDAPPRSRLPEPVEGTLRDIDAAREHGFRLTGGIGWVRFDDPDSEFFRWESR